jgi:hypothetical protein
MLRTRGRLGGAASAGRPKADACDCQEGRHAEPISPWCGLTNNGNEYPFRSLLCSLATPFLSCRWSSRFRNGRGQSGTTVA